MSTEDELYEKLRETISLIREKAGEKNLTAFKLALKQVSEEELGVSIELPDDDEGLHPEDD